MAQRHRRRFLRNLFLILIFSLILWYAKGCPLPTQEMELHRWERQRLAPESTVVWSYQGKRSGDRDMLVGVTGNGIHAYSEVYGLDIWPRSVAEPTLVILPHETRYTVQGGSYLGPALLAVDPPAGAESAQLTLDLSSSWGEEYVFTETAEREESGLFFFQLYPSGGSDLEDGMSIQIWSDFSGLSTFAGYGRYGEENWEWFPYTLEFFDGSGALIGTYDNPAAGPAVSTS